MSTLTGDLDADRVRPSDARTPSAGTPVSSTPGASAPGASAPGAGTSAARRSSTFPALLSQQCWIWTLVISLVTIGLTVSVLVTGAQTTGPARTIDVASPPIVAAIGAAILLAAWIAWGYRAMSGHAGDAARATYLATGIVGLTIAVTGAHDMASLQAVFYPSLWALATSLRAGLIWNTATASMVTFGLTAHAWWVDGIGAHFSTAIGIGLASFLFSTGMGVWLTLAFNRVHEREKLLDRLRAQEAALGQERAEIAAERERARMAADLHDTVAQSVAGIIMLAQRGQRETAIDRTAPLFALIESSADQALTEARSLVAVSSTAGLAYDDGLQRSLQLVCSRFARESGLTVDTAFALDAPDTPDASRLRTAVLNQQVQTLLVRIVQESLSNVRKHAQASRVSVTITRSATPAHEASGQYGLSIVVADNGVGLPEGFDIGQSSGFGLPGLRERIRECGGSISLSSTPFAGTTLEVVL